MGVFSQTEIHIILYLRSACPRREEIHHFRTRDTYQLLMCMWNVEVGEEAQGEAEPRDGDRLWCMGLLWREKDRH